MTEENPNHAPGDVHGGTRNAPPKVDDTDPNAISTVDNDQPGESGGRPRIEIPGRPEGLPDNFNSVADLVAAFQESQRKITELGQGKVPVPDDATPDEKAKVKAKEDEAPKQPDLNTIMDEAEAEFAETGQLSVARRQQLEQAGVSPARIDRFLKGVEAQAREELARLHAAAGGEQMMQTMLAWAAENLPDTELHALNASFDAGGDLSVQAIRSLSQVYHASNGTVPKLLTGSPQGGGAGLDVYPSGAEGRRMMINDMRDPRYRDPNNPSFRREVDAKIERSNL